MTEVSSTLTDLARKNESRWLQALASTGQKALAGSLDWSESMVSRMKDGQIHAAAHMLAGLGLQLVPADFKVVDPVRAQAMFTLYEAALKRMDNPVDLLWEEAA